MDDMVSEAYYQGFMMKCAEYGITDRDVVDALCKFANPQPAPRGRSKKVFSMGGEYLGDSSGPAGTPIYQPGVTTDATGRLVPKKPVIAEGYTPPPITKQHPQAATARRDAIAALAMQEMQGQQPPPPPPKSRTSSSSSSAVKAEPKRESFVDEGDVNSEISPSEDDGWPSSI